MEAHKKMGPSIWMKFNRGKKDKLWFEQEVLKMLKANWEHPLIGEYERLLDKERRLK